MMGKPHLGRRFLLYLLPALLISTALLVYPVYVIRPFRAQGPRELMAALAVLRYRPVGMALCAAAALAATYWYWRRERRWLRRIASAAGLLAVCGAALASRVNIYEIMFHPIARPRFSAGAGSKLAATETVIAVRVGDQARAYPVRGMSYHHVVNDQLSGVAIAATY